MALPGDAVCRVRLRCPETNRWRTYELDAALDATLVQRLNDLAFVYGTEVVSTCAGHDESPGGDPEHAEIAGERAFAEVRFAIFFPSWNPLAGQQARICIERLARACAREDTRIETFHEPDLDRGTRTPRRRRRGRSLVTVRHARATRDGPALAQAWWRRLVAHIDGSPGPVSGHSVLAGNASNPKKRRPRAPEKKGTGDARYALVLAAARQIAEAERSGFYREATTLVESILAERMEKRVQVLHAEMPAPERSLEKVKDGFANLGPLLTALCNSEPDKQAELFTLLDKIKAWAQERNTVIHEAAKLLDDPEKDRWEYRVEHSRQVAKQGKELLLKYDLEERRASHEHKPKEVCTSATCPDALGPLGQADCEWCRAL